jgi:phosphoserine phosphatase RsbU/P
VWFPVLDGTARLGVMSARLSTVDGLALGRGRQLAGALAYLLTTKAAYGDRIVRASLTQRPALAADLRWMTLPPLAFDDQRVAIGAMLQPAYGIAGDAFDYAIEGDRLHLAIFDAVGHGLASSLLATLAIVAYRHGRRDGMSLPELYLAIDQAVVDVYGQEMFVTAQLLELDVSVGTGHMLNAGHPPPLVLREHARPVQLHSDVALPIGLGHHEAEVADVQLERGDTLIYFSDGMVEARSADGSEFGLDRLADVMVKAVATGLHPWEATRRAAHEVVDHHDGLLSDDATIVQVTWRGPEP